MSNNKKAFLFSIFALVATVIVGQIILWCFPDGANIWASVLFILMNLIPMITACVMSVVFGECKDVLEFIKKIFVQKESILAVLLALLVSAVYYGVSVLFKNVYFTGASIGAVLAYFPWTLLQGGLEEVGWRWYLQKHIHIKDSFMLKILAVSVIWFAWHIPIYRLPWITAGSANYLIFYLMILGNSFTFGTVQEFSNGTLPCVLAHMLIDSLAVVMLVQSNVLPIFGLVIIEILLSLIIYYRRRNKAAY